jgi:glycosyltransferase involved in cell wall biosynthesis
MKAPGETNRQSGLFVLGSLYPVYTGGMEIFNYYFLNHQIRKSKDTIYYLGEEKTDPDNGHFIYFKKRRPTRFFYPIQFFLTVYKMRKQLDYVYLSYAEQSWIITFTNSLTLRLFRIPYIVTIHWGKEPEWKFSYPYVSFFKHAHAVVGVSEPVCIAFKKVIPSLDFIYIPPLIPFSLADRGKPELKKQLGYNNNEKILLYVGTLKAMKNPDKIVEALRILGKEFLELQNIRMIFAGSGEMDKELRERVTKYDLNRFVRFEGLVSRERIPDYYKSADCYIISSDYEGTSLSLLEAMFNGLTIIASNGPGINKMVNHEKNALLYETGDVEQLAATIKRIFADSSLAVRLADNALSDYHRQYSYETMIEKYERLFSSVKA